MVEGIKLQNVQTRAILNLDMVTTPDYILESVDWGVVTSNHYSYKYVNQIGVYVTSTSLETRDVEILGWVIADNEMEMTLRKSMLNTFFNPQQAIDLFYADYMLRFLPNTSIRYSVTVAENNEVMCRFKIEGIAPDPLFAEKDETVISALSTTPMFHFPLIITDDPNPPGGIVFGHRQPSLIVTITNKGNVPVGIRIVFKAGGVVEGPSIINLYTQEFFKINKSMVGGEQITVNTNVGEKGLIGTLGNETFNYFKYRDLDSTWLQIEPGDNIFRYDADVNIDNLEVYLHIHNKYLEVQQCY